MGQGIICRYTDDQTTQYIFLHGLSWDAEPKLIAFVLGDVYSDTIEVDQLSDPSVGSFSVHFYPAHKKVEDCSYSDAHKVGHLQFISVGNKPETGFITEASF